MIVAHNVRIPSFIIVEILLSGHIFYSRDYRVSWIYCIFIPWESRMRIDRVTWSDWADFDISSWILKLENILQLFHRPVLILEDPIQVSCWAGSQELQAAFWVSLSKAEQITVWPLALLLNQLNPSRYFLTLPSSSSTSTPDFQHPVSSPIALFFSNSCVMASL